MSVSNLTVFISHRHKAESYKENPSIRVTCCYFTAHENIKATLTDGIVSLQLQKSATLLLLCGIALERPPMAIR
jgi:hypothetical protein